MYHLHLFGRFQLTGPRGVVFRGMNRPLQLLALSCFCNRPRSPAEIARILWHDAEPTSRQHSFRQAIYKLNKAAPGLIAVSDDKVVTDRALITTDLDLVRSFEEGGDFSQLAAVVRGPFMPGGDAARVGVTFAQWVDAQRAEHWTPLIYKMRKHFRTLSQAAEWKNVAAAYAQLSSALADDPVILSVAIRSLIYSAESLTLRREVDVLIRRLKKRSRREAIRLERLLNRRLRWDRKATVHIGPFVGRVSEQQAFGTLYSSGAPAGFLCCISGPLGIGKSRTAKQFARIAAIRGSRIRTAHLALDQANANYAKVARALQELTERSVTHPNPPHSHGRKPPASSTPVVLVVDDIDWAGEACTNLLIRLVATLGDSPSMGIVVTTKESSLVQRLLASVPQGARALHLRLHRLDASERRELLHWLRQKYKLTDEVAQRVDEHSFGVPAYAHRFARRSPSLDQRHGLSEINLAEVRRLAPAALRLFALVSFCGGSVYVTALAKALQTTVEEVDRLARRLVDLGLLEDRMHHQFACADQCVADSIQREFELAELRRLGARVAQETVAVSRLDAARIARRVGDIELESQCYFESAREALGFGSYSDAENLLSQCSSTAVDRRLSARARFWQAEIHLRLRRYDEAGGIFASLLSTPHLLSFPMLNVAKARHAQVLSMKDPTLASMAFDVVTKLPLHELRSVAPKAVVEVLLANAAIGIVSGNLDLLSTVAHSIESELEESPRSPKWLELAATLCKLRLQIDGFRGVLPLCDRHLMRARVSGVPSELASTLVTAAIVNTAAGKLSDAARLYKEVSKIVQDNRLLGFTHIVTSNHAVTLLEMGDSADAIDRLQALRVKDTRIGVGYYLAFDDLNLATAFLEHGDVDRARRHARDALTRKACFPNQEYGTALAIQGLASIHVGDMDSAVVLMNQVDAIRQQWGDLSYGAMLKAAILSDQVSVEHAVQHLLATADRTDGRYRPAAIRLRLVAAELQVTSDPQSAGRIAHDCIQQAASCGMSSVQSRAGAVVLKAAS